MSGRRIGRRVLWSAFVISVSVVAGLMTLVVVTGLRTWLWLYSARCSGVIELWSGLPPEVSVWFPVYWQRLGTFSLCGVGVGVLTCWLLSGRGCSSDGGNETRCRR